MARPVRIEQVGGWYHLTSRGNERREIFRSPPDCLRFLALLCEASQRFGWRLHGYVLMPNHYHLLVELTEENLSRAMQWLNSAYGQWFNRRHRRVGHLFQGRFKGILLDDEPWAVEVSRYLHLNPVRVQGLGLGKRERIQRRQRVGRQSPREEVQQRLELLEAYPWSSYRAYAGLEEKPEWLTCARIWKSFGHQFRASQRAYREFVEAGAREGAGPEIWQLVKGQVILGDDEFLERLAAGVKGDELEQGGIKQLRRRPSWERVVQCVEEARGESWEDFYDRKGDSGREIVFWLARREGGLRLREMGEKAGGINYRSVDSALRRFERRLQADPSLQRILDKVQPKLLTQKNEI